MPITFIGSDNSAQNNPTSGTFSFAGISPEPGDFVLCWWYTRSSTKTFTKPAEVIELYHVSNASYGRLFIGYRIFQVGDSTYAWTSSSVTGSTTVYGTSVFRGVNRSDPIDADSGSPTEFLNTNDPDPPAVNVQTIGACVVPIFGKNNDFTGCVPPTNYMSAGENDSTAGSDASAGAAYRVVSVTGSEDPPAWNLTGGATGDDGYVWTCALKPTLGPTPGQFNKVKYVTEPPSTGWNPLKYASEPPVSSAWNKIEYG